MSRRRKNKSEEHINLERWLVSYADFITLLFAFFVVMYSISSVNEGKYRVLSSTLNLAFDQNAVKQEKVLSKEPIPEGLREGKDLAQTPINEEKLPTSPDVVDVKGGVIHDDQAQLNSVANDLDQILAPYIQDDLIKVKRDQAWIEVEMKSGLLFQSGSSNLSVEAVPMVGKLADVFKSIPNMIHVEGHTDDKPINTREFPSNWELSAARAASVVHELMKDGVDPMRMAALAYGEYHPIADNGTEEGRYKNRRVTIILQSQSMARYKGGLESAVGNAAPPNSSNGQPPQLIRLPGQR
jgi:chemotaxis protein MotB